MRRLRPLVFAGAITLLPISPFIESVADLTSALPLGPATLVGSSVDGARSVVTGDIDGDGDLDAVVASQDDGRVRWFENAAGNASSWTAHQIATRNSASWAVAADVDGDGDQDVIASSWGDNRIAWHENTAGNGSAWTEHAISTATQRPECVFAADIDRDGDIDVFSASMNDDRIAWHENTAGNGSAWTMRAIATTADRAWFVTAGDIDGDGDPDAISGDLANKVAWYQNPGSATGAWTERSVSTANDDVRAVHSADIDGDGDVDIAAVGSANNRIAWYANASGGTAWTEHVVSTSIGGAHSVTATDLDGDSDLDLIVAGFSDNSVVWFNNTAGNGSAWSLTTVSTSVVAASAVFAADADGDGDRDVFASAWDGDAVYWFDNQGQPTTTPNPQPCPECPLVNWLVWLLLLIIVLLLFLLWYCYSRRRG